MASVIRLGQTPAPDESGALHLETPRLLARSNAGGEDGIRFTLFEKAAQREIGWISLSVAEGEDKIAELRCFVEASERGRGLSREALRAVVPAALGRVRAQGLRADIPIDDAAALATARGIGMRPSGRGRGSVQRFEKDLCALL